MLDPIRQQLTQGVTPEKIAHALALGTVMGLFPIFGTTTLLCVFLGIFLRLNHAIMQAVNALCLPLYLPGLVAFVRLGDALTGLRTEGLDLPVMVQTFHRAPREFFRQFGVTAEHALLGWLVVAPLGGVLIYFLCLAPLRRYATRLPQPRAA